MAAEKRIAVAGATGRLGHHAVDILRERGHDVVPISRAAGVDVISGDGLGAAIEGVDLVVDAATGPTPEGAAEFFTTSARNLQQAGAEHGVEGIIVISIIGTDHFDSGYNAAKVVQERAHLEGPVPARILRASQFHEFVAELIGWSRQGEVSYVPKARTQLVAARSVAEALADLIDGTDSAPGGNPIAEVAGPREESLVDAANLFAAQNGNGLRIEAGEWPEDPEGLYPAGRPPPRPDRQAGRPDLRGVAQRVAVQQATGHLCRADPDEGAREHVGGIVDAGMDPGVSDQRRQGPQRRREHRLLAGGPGGKGEGGGGVAGGEGARARHLDVATRKLLGLLPLRAPPAGQRLGDEVGEGRGDAERDEAPPGCEPSVGPTKSGQRDRDREPELAAVGSA